MKIIEVKYVITKSKFSSQYDHDSQQVSLKKEDNFNNIFELNDPIMKFILKDVK